jgi:hypothetical protein
MGREVVTMNLYIDPDKEKRIMSLFQTHKEHEKDTFRYSMTEGDFFHYILMLGILDFEYRIEPKLTGKPYKPFYSTSKKNVVSRSGEVMA